MKWTDHDKHISTSIAGVRFNDDRNHLQNKKALFRVDGRDGTYRVDMKMMGPPEAVDDGRGFSSKALGKRYAASYVAAINKQLTLTPRGVERPVPAPRKPRKAART